MGHLVQIGQFLQVNNCASLRTDPRNTTKTYCEHLVKDAVTSAYDVIFSLTSLYRRAHSAQSLLSLLVNDLVNGFFLFRLDVDRIAFVTK